MIAADTIAEFTERPTLPAVTQLLVTQARELVASANGFRNWTREHLMIREPSIAEIKQHDQVCKWLIRLLRLVQLALAEPDFPEKSMADEVSFLIRRLTEDWEMIHNPMAEAEAQKLIPDLFPA